MTLGELHMFIMHVSSKDGCKSLYEYTETLQKKLS